MIWLSIAALYMEHCTIKTLLVLFTSDMFRWISSPVFEVSTLPYYPCMVQRGAVPCRGGVHTLHGCVRWSPMKDKDMVGLVSAWAMAKRGPKEYRRNVDAAMRHSGVCPHTWPDLEPCDSNRQFEMGVMVSKSSPSNRDAILVISNSICSNFVCLPFAILICSSMDYSC